MTIGGIGLEIGTDIRQPDISVIRVVYPLPVRAQIIIKRLIGSFRLRFRGRRRRGRRHRLRRRRRRCRPLNYIGGTTSG
jgi:hypothetical protein